MLELNWLPLAWLRTGMLALTLYLFFPLLSLSLRKLAYKIKLAELHVYYLIILFWEIVTVAILLYLLKLNNLSLATIGLRGRLSFEAIVYVIIGTIVGGILYPAVRSLVKVFGWDMFWHRRKDRDWFPHASGYLRTKRGLISKHLAREYHLNVTGTDIDPEMIQFSKKSIGDLSRVFFLEMDATRLAFEDNEFDIALSFGVLHHIGGWKEALREIARVLKPQGFFVLGDLAYSILTTRILRPMVRNYGVYTINDIIHCLGRDGFEVIHQERPTGMVMKYHSLVLRKMHVRPHIGTR